MELRHLRYFMMVAQERSFSTAAKKLFVSQPALSKQIKDLEEEIGKPLLARSSKSVELTEAGFFLKERAEEILERSNKTLSALKTADENISGKINIVSGEMEGVSFVARAIKKMNALYPKVQFNLTTGDEFTVRDQLDKGIADFGFFVDLTVLPSYDSIQIPTKSQWGLMTWRSNPLAQNHFICPKDLLNVPVMVSRQMLSNNSLSGWLKCSMDKLNIVGTNDMLYNASKLAEAQVASIITIDGIVNTKGTHLKFVPFKPSLPIKISIAWRKQHLFNKACEKFLEILKEI